MTKMSNQLFAFMFFGLFAFVVLLCVVIVQNQRIQNLERREEPKRFKNEPDDYVKWFVGTWGQQEPDGRWLHVEIGLHQNGSLSYRWTEKKPLINPSIP